ncbi:MAG TPA: hypothetical protein VM513_03785 [Kofleriaceae bacterium]|jgi:hypothetical protein|nr:hypothetical protein [Kofleriaceae bacterium]
MKTALLPSIRVEAALRRQAERLRAPGQTLSALLEELLREGIAARTSQAEFLDRALAAEAETEAAGTWVTADELRQRLRPRQTRRPRPRTAARR